MLAPLVKAIAGLTRSKAQSVFLTPNIKDLVRAHVKDKDRAAEILRLLAEYEAAATEFHRERQERLKLFRTMQRDRNASQVQMQLLLQEDLTEHQILQNKLIKARVQGQKLIEPEEWEEIRKSARKTEHKTFEQRQTAIKEWNDTRLKIESRAEKAVGERDRLRDVRSILKLFWRHLADLTQARNVRPAAHPVLGNREATEDDLRQVATEVNKIRQEAYDAFVAAHAKLVENITEKEWKKIF